MRYVFVCLFLLNGLIASAQINKISVWVAPFTHDTSGQQFTKYAELCHASVSKFLLTYGRFAVVERGTTRELEAERRLQKSESFIDGKVVEQGRAIGAEYILNGHVSVRTGKLFLTITSLADNTTVEAGECDIKNNILYGEGNLVGMSTSRKVARLLPPMLERWLAKEKFTLVRSLEDDDDETKKVLVAAGTAKGIKKGAKLEVFYTVKETVDDEELERFVSVGELKVDTVENANFSTAKVRDGEKEIKKLLTSGQKLYCRFVTKD